MSMKPVLVLLINKLRVANVEAGFHHCIAQVSNYSDFVFLRLTESKLGKASPSILSPMP